MATSRLAMRPKRYALRVRLRRSLPFYVYLIPTFVLLGFFSYYPIVSAFRLSFFDADFGSAQVWAGLRNFTDMWHDEALRSSVPKVALWVVFQLAVQLTVPLFIAELIFHLKRESHRNFWRMVFVIPMVVPGIAVWLIWRFIYSDQGIVNAFLTAIGQEDMTRGWLNAPGTALGSLFMIGFPFVYPIAMLIFYAGLLQIPSEVQESARLDGAKALRRFFTIDVPLLLGQVRLILVLVVITVITQSYQIVLVLTGGGPGDATMMPGLVLYNDAFGFQRLGYACAIGVVMFIVVLILTLVINRVIRSSTEFEAR